MTTATSTSILRGGEWLLQDGDADGVFTPERLTEEHRLIGRTAQEFVDNEVLPVLDKLEQKDWDLARKLVQRGGSLGLLGVDVPEAYGGVGLDKVTSLVVSEKLAQVGVVRRSVRRAGQPHDRSPDALRNRSTETEVPAEADVGRADWRVRAQ